MSYIQSDPLGDSVTEEEAYYIFDKASKELENKHTGEDDPDRTKSALILVKRPVMSNSAGEDYEVLKVVWLDQRAEDVKYSVI